MAGDEIPDEQNPAELLKRIQALESGVTQDHCDIGALMLRVMKAESRDADLEAGIVRMATYLGVMHVLKDTGPK